MPKKIKQHLKNNGFFNPFTEITGKEISSEDFADNLRKQDLAKNITISYHMPELLRIL
jgi:hypothetical protein